MDVVGCSIATIYHCINPLSLNIHIQILQTDLHTFPLRMSWKNLTKDHSIFSLVIILLILISFFLIVHKYCWEEINVVVGLEGLREGNWTELAFVKTSGITSEDVPVSYWPVFFPVATGADPGFFSGGGALVSCFTSTPINHIVFFQNTSCIRKPQVISDLPLHQ